MNYTNSKARPSSPPSLPRFSLEHDGDSGSGEVDPLDVAATAQRPAVDAVRARRVVRASKAPPPPVLVDATSEVQVEDILLEVYAEESPPTRRSPGAAPPPRPSPTMRPPAPAESAAVDALLRASDPGLLSFGGFAPVALRPPTPLSAFAYTKADHESPSVAPVAFPSMSLALSAPSPTLPSSAFPPSAAAPTATRRSRGALAMWTTLVLVLGVGLGTAGVIAVRDGTYARLRDRARAAAAARRAPPPASPSVPPPDATAAVVAPPAPVAAPAPAAPAVPNVSVDSLPQSAIPADSSMVTFPASAQGHRVFFDGRPLIASETPMQLKCGRHMIRIGSTGKARVTDLACGRPVTLLR